MAAGGMHDQLGGGFPRYSVDAEWLVPHFEKMLYDNAQLVNLYLDAYLVSGETKYRERCARHLRLCFARYDASAGRVLFRRRCRQRRQRRKILLLDKSRVVETADGRRIQCRRPIFRHDRSKGNFVDHSDPEPLPKQNVLSIVQSESGRGDKPLLASAKKKMFDAPEASGFVRISTTKFSRRGTA